MPSVPLFEVEAQLARHGGALRSLARELLGGGDGVDDAVQETWLRALQTPPRHGSGLGAWLATILRNVAFRARRGEARRRRREAEVAGARGAAAEDHAAVLARTETGHRLLAAVEALEPTLRDVVWLRYFEGKAPREIAAASGVPIATVKSRLQRGLGTLRERLGEREGTDWRAGFAAAFGLVNEGTAATVAVGGLLMATWTKVTVALTAAAAIAAMVWWLLPPDVIAPTARSQASTPLPVTAEVEAKATVLRDAVAAASAPAPTPAAATAAGLARCRGRVVDAVTKAPVAGAVVTLRRSMGQQAEASDLVCTTSNDGAFVFEFTSEWTSPRLWFRAADHLQAWRDVGALDAGQDDDVGDAELSRGRSLAGRIVDELGMPLPNGTVLRAMFRSRLSGTLIQPASLEMPIGVDGAFRFEPAVALGPVDFELAGGEHELKQQVIVTASEPAALTLVARRRAWIHGIVVDETSAPIAGVRVGAWAGGPEATTSADGSFTLLRPNGWVRPTSELRVVHGPQFLVSHTPDVPWGTDDLRIVLRRAPPVPIDVVDDAGAAVEAFGIVMMRDGTDGIPRGAVVQRAVYAGGRHTIEGVDPGKTSLRVVPVDAGLSPSAMIAIATSEPLRVVLARRVPCTVEVSRGGAPAAGVRVQILFVGPDGVKHEPLPEPTEPHRGERAWLPPSPQPELVAEGRTDANGVVSLLRDVDLQQLVVQVRADGAPPLLVRNPTFPAKVELPGTGTITGRVQLRGRHRSKAQVEVSGPTRCLLTPQPDGTFRSPPLRAGTCRIEFAGIAASARDVDVRDGETTVVDFDFAEHPPAAVHGRLRRDGGLPGGLTAELLLLAAGSRPAPAGSAAIAPDGTFVIGELQAGTYRLAVRAADTPALAMPGMLADTYVLAAGEQLRVDVPFPRRRLVVRLHHPDGSLARGARVLTRCDGAQWPSFALFVQPIDGVMVLDPAPTLPVEFAIAANKPPVWSAPVVMPPDRAEAEVTVVLPAP